MQKRLIGTLCAGILVLAGVPAFGATFTFNFNSLTGYSSSAANQESSIASQLQTQLQTVCPSCTITATSGTGAVIDKTYTGEGNVVGPTSGTSVMPETLGDIANNTTVTSNSQYSYSTLNSNGFKTQFLSNTNDSSSQISNEISFRFSGLTITGASFNYEVFPSDDPPGALEFEAGNNTNGTDTQQFSQSGLTPSSSGSDGSSTHSTNSGTGSASTDPQYIGSWSGSFAASTELDFVDWPPTIGIDDLTITFTDAPPTGVPEPNSILLLPTAALATLLIARRKFRRA